MVDAAVRKNQSLKESREASNAPSSSRKAANKVRIGERSEKSAPSDRSEY